jgi:uncharacterized caspase-like protein
MKKLLFAFITLFVAAALNVGHAATPLSHKKVALVIGNGAYKNAVELPNPKRDATLMATTLRTAGFTVIEGTDLDKAGMSALIDQFTEAAYDSDVALVYYSGHGMQVDGVNYLSPIDGQLEKASQLQTRTISINQILAALPPDPAVGMVFLDACRDNPLARTFARALPASRSSSLGAGLAAVQANRQSTGTGGLLIAYATDPGAVAYDGSSSNSPYTTALAKHLTTRGLEIQSALTRVRADVVEETGGAQRPWLSTSLGREIFLGGEPPTLEVSAPEETTDNAGAQSADGAGVDWTVEQKLWDEASKRNTIAHYELYLSQYPNGRFASVARLNIDQLKAEGETKVANLGAGTDSGPSGSQVRTGMAVPDDVKQTPGTQETEALIKLDRNSRIDLQLRLSALGLNTGGFDGSLGPRSRVAIGAWQRQSGIVETTYLTPQQHMLLVVQTDPLMADVRAKYEADKAAQQKKQAQETTKSTKKKQQTATTTTKKTKQTASTTTKKKTTQTATEEDIPYKPRRAQPADDGGAGSFAAGALLGTAIGVAIGRH